MKKRIVVPIISITIVAAFFAGYVLNPNSDRLDSTVQSSENGLANANQETPHLESELEKAQMEIERLKDTIDGLRKSEEESNQTLEELNEKQHRNEEVLLQLTDGVVLNYETIKSDKDNAVVYVLNAPKDYYEREKLLMKLGVDFAGFNSVSFWDDKNQAESFIKGELERNSDSLLPPYIGMFGEIKTTDQISQLLLHGSTGGPLYLTFGKYQLPAKEGI